jgi:mRNA interferase MazF
MVPVRRGDIVLLPLPYVQNYKKGKTRPALVVQNNIANQYSPNLIVALISSVRPPKPYPMHFHIDIASEEHCGLTTSSIVKTEVIVTIPKTAVIKKLGFLSREAMRGVDDCLRLSLNL